MAARKLNIDQIAELRELVSRRRLKDGASFTEVTADWNAEHPDFQITAEAVRYHMTKMRREHLSNKDGFVAALTERTLATLDAIANGDFRALARWANGRLTVRASDELTASEAAMIATLTFKGADGESGSKGGGEVTLSLANRTSAARALLSHLHGSKLSVTDSGAIVRRLTESGDRDGLERIAAGEDPVRVLIDRAPFLSLADADDEDADAKG